MYCSEDFCQCVFHVVVFLMPKLCFKGFYFVAAMTCEMFHHILSFVDMKYSWAVAFKWHYGKVSITFSVRDGLQREEKIN